jgi:hypothetical protein
MKRSPIKKKPRRKGPLPPETAALVLARDQTCRAWAMGFALDVVCSGRPHIHHRVLRSQGGGDEPESLLLLCSAHHDLAHNSRRKEANLAGVILKRTTV